MIPKNTWVQIQKVVLDPSHRATNIPDDTKKVPLFMWTKGYLLEHANVGDQVSIKTVTNRIETGILVEANPTYLHNYGAFVEENLVISTMVKTIVFGGDDL
jgi:hypothetical protein